MNAALRDASFFPCPAGYAINPKPPKYHAIVDRGGFNGPACGYPLHNEETEVEAGTIPLHQRCHRPGCRKAFEGIPYAK